MNKNEEIKEFQNYLISEALSKNQDPEKYIKELGEEGLKEAYLRFQEYKKKKAKKAAHGAKLNYFKSLKNQCAEDEEVVYYKKGGSVGCGCKKKEEGGEIPSAKKGCSAVEKFKSIKKAGFGDVLIKIADNLSGGGFRKAEEEKRKRTISSVKKGPGTTKQPTINGTKKMLEENNKKFKNDYSSKRVKDSEEDYLKGKTNEAAAEKCGGKVKKKAEGSKINKDCNGAVAKFKALRKGGSLNGIPFMQKGTPKGGVKWKTSPRPDYIDNGKPVYPSIKYSPERGNAEKHYLIDPYSGTLLDSSESNFMNDLEDTRYPMGGYDASYDLAKDWDTNSKKYYRKNPILVSGFISDLIENRGFGRQIGSSWGNAYPHNPGWIKNPLFKKGYYYRY